MRLAIRALMVAILALWAWLAVSGNALLVWQGREDGMLVCSFVTALHLHEGRYLDAEGGPLGRLICPLTVPRAEWDAP